MEYPRNIIIVLALAVVILLLIPEVAVPCPSCFGSPNSTATEGMNMAIFSLLGITGTVLVAFALFFLHLRRRAKQIQDRFNTMMN